MKIERYIRKHLTWLSGILEQKKRIELLHQKLIRTQNNISLILLRTPQWEASSSEMEERWLTRNFRLIPPFSVLAPFVVDSSTVGKQRCIPGEKCRPWRTQRHETKTVISTETYDGDPRYTSDRRYQDDNSMHLWYTHSANIRSGDSN